MLGILMDADARRVIVKRNIVNVSRWASCANLINAYVATARTPKKTWKEECKMMTFSMSLQI